MNQKLNVLAVFFLLAIVTEYSITVLAQAEAEDKFCGNSNPCQNGGKCIRAGDGVASGFCLCKKNYGGTYCEKSTGSFCSESEPCQNGGQCIRAGDDKPAQCACPQGYTGRLCEQSS